MFNPGRFSLARRRRKLTKKAIAEALDLTPHTILRYESGDICPPAEMVEKIANVLSFPADFFMGDDIEEPSELAASFRSLSAMSAKERDSALAAGALAFTFSDWIEERFNLPHADTIDLSADSPEVAARSLRQYWGIGERPIKNMVQLLEAKGVRVFSLAENTKTVDAFSLWRGIRPYVFLNTIKSGEHGRFDAAHELGHLVLHKHGGPNGRSAEDQANQFASSFLMPAADVLATIPRVHSLNQIIETKKRWSVSVMALIYRLWKLKILSDWQYRTFCIQATERGYRKAEPHGISREQSIVWQKVMTELWKERITRHDIAKTLHIPPEEVDNILFGLTSAAIPEWPEESERPNRGSGLRLVPD